MDFIWLQGLFFSLVLQFNKVKPTEIFCVCVDFESSLIFKKIRKKLLNVLVIKMLLKLSCYFIKTHLLSLPLIIVKVK